MNDELNQAYTKVRNCFTPYALKVLLHAYVCSEPPHGMHYPAILEAIESLQRLDLIESSGIPNGFQVTDRGRAHVIQLLTLSLPEPKWVNVEGEVIQFSNA